MVELAALPTDTEFPKREWEVKTDTNRLGCCPRLTVLYLSGLNKHQLLHKNQGNNHDWKGRSLTLPTISKQSKQDRPGMANRVKPESRSPDKLMMTEG